MRFNNNLRHRAELPAHVVTMLNNMPSKLHPMSQFSAAVTALNSESKFAKAYSEGVHKSKYWEVRIIVGHTYLHIHRDMLDVFIDHGMTHLTVV